MIERDVLIEAPASRVWQLLTEPDQLAKWYAFDGAEVDLRPGGAILFRWKEHGDFHARVEAVEVGRRFAFRLAARPDEKPAEGNSTLVEFTVAVEAAGTRLTVTETGFDRIAGGAQHEQDQTAGWEGGLETLKSLT